MFLAGQNFQKGHLDSSLWAWSDLYLFLFFLFKGKWDQELFASTDCLVTWKKLHATLWSSVVPILLQSPHYKLCTLLSPNFALRCVLFRVVSGAQI